MRATLSLLALSIAVGATAQVDPARVVATVNGEPITGAVYYRRMENLPGMSKLFGGSSIPGTPGYFTLQQIINELVMLDLAEQKGVAPSEADIDRELAIRLQGEPDLIETYLNAGLTEDDLRLDTKIALAEFNLITMGINITDLEVETHYNNNPDLYTYPKRYVLRIIAVKDAAARRAVDEALAAGTPFEEVAKAHSGHPTASLGGAFGEIAVDNLSPQAQAALEGVQAGQASGWIGTESMVKFYVEEIKPAVKLELNDALREQIRRRLMLDRGTVRNDVAAMMAEARKSATIDFKGHPYEERLRNYFGGADGG